MIRFAGAALAALATLAVATTAAAQVPDQTPAESVRVVRDKETGKLRAPDHEELKALLEQERAARAARGQPEPGTTPVAVRRHANGMRSAKLGTEHLVSLQGQRGADGKLAVSHNDAAHEHGTSTAAGQAAKE